MYLLVVAVGVWAVYVTEQDGKTLYIGTFSLFEDPTIQGIRLKHEE